MSVLDMIIELRGGIPDNCDFCGQLFTEKNYPTPEEGGEWACIECVKRWEQEYKQ
jgi:hypothetical protein